MLWIPPGWYHAVKTGGGQMVEYKDQMRGVCYSWVSWALPSHLVGHAVCNYMAGKVTEGQGKHTPKKGDVYAAYCEYAYA